MYLKAGPSVVTFVVGFDKEAGTPDMEPSLHMWISTHRHSDEGTCASDDAHDDCDQQGHHVAYFFFGLRSAFTAAAISCAGATFSLSRFAVALVVSMRASMSSGNLSTALMRR